MKQCFKVIAKNKDGKIISLGIAAVDKNKYLPKAKGANRAELRRANKSKIPQHEIDIVNNNHGSFKVPDMETVAKCYADSEYLKENM